MAPPPGARGRCRGCQCGQRLECSQRPGGRNLASKVDRTVDCTPLALSSETRRGRNPDQVSVQNARMSRDVVDFSGLRQDGRRANETRQVHCNWQSVALGHMRACRCAASSASVQTRTVPLSSRSGTRRSLLPSLGRVRSVAIMPVLALQSRPASPRLSGVQKGADAARPRHIDFPALSRVVRERAGGQ
jgi:hypothetical protein